MKFGATATSAILLSSQAYGFSMNNARLNRIADTSSTQLLMGQSNTGLENKNSPISSALSAASIAEPPTIVEPSSELEEAEPKKKTYLDDGFVFGMEGSGLKRPRGKVAQVVLEGDTLETQPHQVAIVSATFAAHLCFAINACTQLLALNDGNMALSAAMASATLVSSWLLADLGSGVLHWSVDNYGNGRTPIMGGIIGAFQGHHSAQWTITERAFFNNVWKLCIPFGIPTVAAITLLAGSSHPLVSLFFTAFCALEIGSQEFHKWSHMTKSQLNPVIMFLQSSGLTINRISHSRHHISPYDGNYCIVSGFWNDMLDQSGVFRRFERIIYSINGVESNAWKIDPKLKEKTLRGEYSL